MHPIIDGGGPSLNKHNCFIELACSLFNHSFIHSFVGSFIIGWTKRMLCVCVHLLSHSMGAMVDWVRDMGTRLRPRSWGLAAVAADCNALRPSIDRLNLIIFLAASLNAQVMCQFSGCSLLVGWMDGCLAGWLVGGCFVIRRSPFGDLCNTISSHLLVHVRLLPLEQAPTTGEHVTPSSALGPCAIACHVHSPPLCDGGNHRPVPFFSFFSLNVLIN